MASWRPVVSEHGFRRVLKPADALEGKGTLPAGGAAGQALVKASDDDFDVGWAVAAGLAYVAANADAAAVPRGGAVAVHPSGSGVVLAQASAVVTACVGLAVAAAGPGQPCPVQTGGVVQLEDWTAVVGSITLAAASLYFLAPAGPGLLTTAPPTTPGQIVQAVGVAVAPDTLALSIQVPILL